MWWQIRLFMNSEQWQEFSDGEFDSQRPAVEQRRGHGNTTTTSRVSGLISSVWVWRIGPIRSCRLFFIDLLTVDTVEINSGLLLGVGFYRPLGTNHLIEFNWIWNHRQSPFPKILVQCKKTKNKKNKICGLDQRSSKFPVQIWSMFLILSQIFRDF